MSPLLAAKAYAQVQNPAAASPKAMSPTDDGPSFGDLVKNTVTDAVNTSRHAESRMIAQTQGKADLVDVVTAISSAQASLETVMAVRDQVITAYKEILSMPI